MEAHLLSTHCCDSTSLLVSHFPLLIPSSWPLSLISSPPRAISIWVFTSHYWDITESGILSLDCWLFPPSHNPTFPFPRHEPWYLNQFWQEKWLPSQPLLSGFAAHHLDLINSVRCNRPSDGGTVFKNPVMTTVHFIHKVKITGLVSAMSALMRIHLKMLLWSNVFQPHLSFLGIFLKIVIHVKAVKFWLVSCLVVMLFSRWCYFNKALHIWF